MNLSQGTDPLNRKNAEIRGYRFLPAQYVDSFCQGNIYLSTLERYAKMEGPEWIADPSEGKMEAIGSLDIRGDDPDKDVKLSHLPPNMVQLDGANSRFTLSGTQIVRKMPLLYIFCCSIDPFEIVRKAMCEDAPEAYRYDACVQIENINELFQRIRQTGRINDQPVEAFVLGANHKPVSYTKVVHDYGTAPLPPMDAFAKPKKFAPQQEYRFVFAPRSQTGLPDQVHMTFNPGHGLLTPMSI